MITDSEIIKDIKNVMVKVKHMIITYKNNDIWKEINSDLNNILIKLKKDKQMYGY